MSLDALCRDWDRFLPRDAKASTFAFELVTDDGRRGTYKLKFAFYCYIEAFQYNYAANSLRECLLQFIEGAVIGSTSFPGNAGMTFLPASLKVVKIAPGYARPDALAKLRPIFAAAFPTKQPAAIKQPAPKKAAPNQAASKKAAPNQSATKKLATKKPAAKRA